MKYEESYTQFDAGLLEHIRRAVPASFTGTLRAGGMEAVLPTDRELELKVKLDVGEDGGALTLKVTWDSETGEEEESEDDVTEEDED